MKNQMTRLTVMALLVLGFGLQACSPEELAEELPSEGAPISELADYV